MEEDRKPINDWRELTLFLGYNLHDPSSLQRLADNFAWLNRKREAEENRKKLRPSIVISAATVIISSMITLLTTWHEWMPWVKK